jgi:hypothetical protein
MSYAFELLDAAEFEEEPEEFELELDALEEELADEPELEDVGDLIFGAPGSGLAPPHPNRDTQRHNKTAYFITALPTRR